VTADRSPRAFVVLSLALLAATGCSRPVAEEVTSETPVPVRTEAASVGDMRGVVHATAIVTPSPGAEMIVVAPEASRIVAMPRAAGDRVRRGEVLVRFEIPTSVADVQRQQAEMARAQAMLESARAAQTRAGELFERGVAARREVEDANRAAADAEAALAQAKAALRSAETVAARSTVRAEFDGIVARRLHNPGDLVEATAADVVLRVVDPQRLELIAAVPISDAPRVAVGATARLSGEPTAGPRPSITVIAGPTAVDPGAATVPVRLALRGLTGVPVGAPVQVDIDAERRTKVVLIPTVAVVREGEDTAVFVAKDGKAERRTVRLGLGDGAHIEILSGVSAGEQIIVDGQAGLPDGAAIAITADTGTTTPEPKPSPARDGAK
jgi:RND family efflux transporter MFP subunit